MAERKQKEQTIQKVLRAIEHKLDEKRIRQKELINLCEQKGYMISQSELSRILAHKVALGLYPALALCDVLEIDLNQILHPERKERDRFNLSQKAFVTDPGRSEIKNYLGCYHALFYATDFREDKLLHGRLRLLPGSDGNHTYCSAFFLLDTEDTDMRGRPIRKEYFGQFFVSPQMGIAYCFLVNNKLGEVCSIEFRHRTFFYKQVECRLGMVLTTSTGEKKTPAAHKMVIFRGKLEDAQEERLAHMLKLDNTEVSIESGILGNIGETEEEKEVFRKLAELLPQTAYCTVNTALLKSVNRKLSNVQISSLFSRMRQYSEEDYTLHLDELEDEMVFDLLRRDPDILGKVPFRHPGALGDMASQKNKRGRE